MARTKLYDNTRLSAHRNCNRLYYWRHVRNFTPDTTASPLVFGSAWHSAMDFVWAEMKNERDNIALRDGAMTEWARTWTDEGFPLDPNQEEMENLKARNPDTAYAMLTEYIPRRRPFIEQVEVLSVEQSFAVPLNPNDPGMFYVGRIDKTVDWEGRVWVVDHKTTTSYKKDGYFTNAFIDGFSPDSQIDGYLHATHMTYGDKAKGCMIDAALVHRSVHEGFMFIPVDRDVRQLNAWLWEALYETTLIETNREHLPLAKDNDIMPAFPKNTTYCSNWGGCRYLDLCKGIINPEMEITEVPMGFKEERWEPYDTFELEKIGITPEG